MPNLSTDRNSGEAFGPVDGQSARVSSISRFPINVYEGMNGNPHYPKPLVDMATLKATLDSLSAAIAEGLDGGRKAIARRNDLEQKS